MQERRPAAATTAGLAMLVDQADTPLFLGAIHRTSLGTTLDELAQRAAAHRRVRPGRLADACRAGADSTLVVTDGENWATSKLALPADRAAVEVLHDELLPRPCRAARRLGQPPLGRRGARAGCARHRVSRS